MVVNDTPENLETVDDAGFSYPGEMGAVGLRAVLERLLKDPALAVPMVPGGHARPSTGRYVKGTTHRPRQNALMTAMRRFGRGDGPASGKGAPELLVGCAAGRAAPREEGFTARSTPPTSSHGVVTRQGA